MDNPNPAYVEWVLMVKDGVEKMVHPGNVENHLNAGWTLKNPPVEAAPATEDSKVTSMTLPELTDAVVAHEEEEKKTAKKAASKKKTDAAEE